MKKSHILIAVIILLSALNILQLVGRFSKPTTKGKAFFVDLAAQEMNLNNAQKMKFIKFTDKHKNEIDELQKEQKKLIGVYFDEPNDSLMLEISRIEQAKIRSTNTHFFEVKSILQPNQFEYFELFKENAVNHILRKSDAKKPPVKK